MKVIITLVLLSLICGCTLYTPATVDPVDMPIDFKEAIKIDNTGLETSWWKNFNDENLNQLVDLALKNNLGYQMAQKNVDAASTYISESIINRLPNINLGYHDRNAAFYNTEVDAFGFEVKPDTKNFTFEYLFGSVSYEVDLWNRKGNITKQTQVNLCIAEAERRVTKLRLISEVVNTYFKIATLNANIANLKKQADIANTNLKVTTVQYKNGLLKTNAVKTASTQKATIEKDIYNQQKQQKIYTNYLAYLIGQYPENFNYEIGMIEYPTSFNKLLPPALPSQAIANRPDVQSSFLQVLSYGYHQKETIANFLPNFQLFAAFGEERATGPNLVETATLALYGLNLVQKFTDIAANYSRYERSEDLLERAVLNYKDNVLNAFQEVDDALLSYTADQDSLTAYKTMLDNSSAELKTATIRYKAGVIDQRTYLSYELTQLQDNYNLANQYLMVYTDVIQIYKTLGLGVNEENDL